MQIPFSPGWLGYDNIRRNVLISVCHPLRGPRFCAYLKRKFPQFDGFVVAEVLYPSPTRFPGKFIRRPVYTC